MTTTATLDRDETIKRIRTALRTRSGKAWSVSCGRGTSWGWIRIDAPPARKTCHCRLKDGATSTRPEDYEMVDTGVAGGDMTDADRVELATLLGLDTAHRQGVSIAAGSDYYAEYVDRAEGRQPSRVGVPYWD